MRPYYKYDDDDRERYYRPSGSGGFGSPMTPAVKWIMGVCIAVFLMEVILGGPNSRADRAVVELFGFIPSLAVGQGWVWQFATYMFLHASFWHIFLNLFFFWMIGGAVEQGLGTRKFLWLYFLSGIAGAAAQVLVAVISPAHGNVPTVGASGAIMGVTAAVAVLYPDATMLLFFVLPIKMRYFPWVLVLFQIWGLTSEARGAGENVAYCAHLAGLGAGYLFMKWHQGFSWSASHFYYRIKNKLRRSRLGQTVTHISDEEKYREEVDRLLDKIFKEGPGSLSQGEKEFLKRQSEKYRK
jgi:membrane associated rhomboid family serine protease